MISYSCEELGVSKTLVIRDFNISNDQMNSDAIKKLEFRTSSSGHEIGDFVFIEQLDQNYCFEIVDIREDGKSHIFSFKKTKYERPYKLETIKAKYPEKIYKKLVSDECHAWRARTGIDMIHLEPDDAEQKRTIKNWGLLPDKYKRVSDAKCIEIFGVTNEEHAKIVKDEKNVSDDPTFRSIIAAYKSKFGFDLSGYRLVLTKTPRYTNGKPAHFPLERFGGCWTKKGIVYLNSNLGPVIKFYKLKNTSVQDLKKTLLAHELAHGIYNDFADAAFKDKYLGIAKRMSFTTPYLEHVKASKLREETFCEFLAAIICGKITIG